MMEETKEVRIGRYLSGEAGRDEREAFEKELELNSELKESFLLYRRIWENMPVETKVQWNCDTAWQKFTHVNQPDVRERMTARRLSLKWAIAALIILALGSFVIMRNSGRPVTYAYNDKSSDPVSLSDGSKIFLNKGASVDVYPFTHKKRRTALHGEALFDVSPDPTRPFTVESGGTITEVVGTSFNITQETDHTRIFVLRGKVIFKASKYEQEAVALTAGEAAIFEGNRMQLIPNPSPNISAWHTKQLRFIKMPMKDVIADVSSYFGQEISIEDESVKSCPITIPLPFKEPELSSVLQAIALSVNGSLKKEGNQYIIQGGHCQN